MADYFGPREFQDRTDVSRETLERLEIYAAILTKWQNRINLVGPATLPDLWRRHFWDSAQIFPILPPLPLGLLDFGAGAGFPGLVLAIMGVENVHLVESNGRKCVFLREVARETGTDVVVHNARIEALEPFPVTVVTARAVAPLSRLVEYALPFMAPGSICLFLKGRHYKDELTETEKTWNIRVHTLNSSVDPEGVILQLERPSPHGVQKS